MSADLVQVRKGAYHDSVSLMRVSQALKSRPGVEVALIGMATELNLDLVRDLTFEVPESTPGDLIIAIRVASPADVQDAVEELERQFAALSQGGTAAGTATRSAPHTTLAAIRRDGQAPATAGAGTQGTVVLVSVPGENAFVEAMDAVEAGLPVMIFSDNVPVEREILLKERAAETGSLVMGPDCGTAVIGGVGLGFANVLRPGSVGVVAASGTGAQQVTSLLDLAGVGVSHVLGVGGRDLSERVGGRSTLRALRALDEDPGTELILLLSKPPADTVARAVRAAADAARTPVVTALLGPGQDDLTDAVGKVLKALGHPIPDWPSWITADRPPLPHEPQQDQSPQATGREATDATEDGSRQAAGDGSRDAPVESARESDRADDGRHGARGALRGLYSGGTLCAEAELIVGGSRGEFTDFGDDEYTRGRAHPMIDPSLRLEALAETTAPVILLDVVLGLAADPDPQARLTPAVRAARERGAAVVVALVGTEADPQGLTRQATALRDAGASVFVSNAAAARHAAALLGESDAASTNTPRATATTPPTTTDSSTDEPGAAEHSHEPGQTDTGEPGAAEVRLPLGEPRVITVGAVVLGEALDQQAVSRIQVEWRPPLAGTPEALARVLADPRRGPANAKAVGRLMSARPQLVGVRPAREVLDLPPGRFFHAGPPIDWERASGPMRGALIGAMLFEGLAADPEEAAERLSKGAGVTLDSCHHHRTVGPMAGVVSPSMWMLEVTDAEHGGTAYCSLNEGLGKVLRYGSYGPEVIDRLRWMGDVLGPALQAALTVSGPIDVRSLIAQALQMGDELHNRNRAATSLLVRELAPAIVDAAPGHAAEVLRFINGNDHFFLNAGMASAKVSADSARDIPGSSLVVSMARNGTDFGIQVSGLGDRWFTGPAGVPDGLYLGAYGPDDANPDIGDSTITETSGLGGFAMAAAPAIVRFVGGDVSDAVVATTSMYEITLAEHPAYQIPGLNFRGTPTGIDVTLVARTGILPVVNTGIAGRIAGTGQVGAGLVSPPAQAFTAALEALAAR